VSVVTLAELSDWIAMAGTAAFASSAVLCVAEKKVDLFAAIVLGLLPAVGGGTIRDVILEVPVFWAADLRYIWVAIGASTLAFLATPLFRKRRIRSLYLYVDGLAVAMFAIEATGKVWDLDFGLPLAPIILGVITAIGGGLMRDVLVGRPTLLLSRELYAIPTLLGCVLFVLILSYVPQWRLGGSIVCILLTFGIRAAAIRWEIRVPDWATIGVENG